LAFPVAALKNGIRIVTLVLLSLHVDMRFMTSSLHRDGGFVFFIIGVLIMLLLLKILRKTEPGAKPRGPSQLAPIRSSTIA
jgi:exosortase/archaeosortase family protein